MALAIRDAATDGGDEDFILALNAACTPAVSEMSRADLRAISAAAHRVLVAEAVAGPCGFVILLRPAAPYPSDNYAWFEQRFSRHLYVDRIAIDASVRGQGAGRALYVEAMKIAAANNDERITAEVNVEPPNPQSMSFHEALGFRHLATRSSRSGKVVAMLELSLDRA